MNQSIILLPYEGVRFEAPYGEGTVRFGDTAESVRKVLGSPENDPSEETLFFHNANIQIHIGEGGVHFIEFAANPKKDGVAVCLEGHNLAGINAIDCVALLKQLNGDGSVAEDEAPESYAFQTLGLTVWQEVSYQGRLDELNEAKAKGDDEELEYLEEEAALAEHFDSVAIGSQEYMKDYF